MQITIIGTGNTATVLGKAFRHAGHDILRVAGRDEAKLLHLARELQAEPYLMESRRHWREAGSEVTILAVSDDAIPAIGATLRTDQLIAHTAGALSSSVLAACGPRYGVFYPLQSLRKELDYLPEIPLLIQANEPSSLARLRELGSSISSTVRVSTDQERLAAHLGAVVAGNFSNYLYTLCQAWCQRQQIDFQLLTPLIVEVAGRTVSYDPGTMQTGPAIRGDRKTIATHEALIHEFPALRDLYTWMTEQITSNKSLFFSSH